MEQNNIEEINKMENTQKENSPGRALDDTQKPVVPTEKPVDTQPIQEEPKVVEEDPDSIAFGISIDQIKNFALIIGLSALSIFLLMAIIIPQFSRYRDNSSKETQLDLSLSKVSGQLTYIQEIIDLQEEFEKNSTLAAQALPLNEEQIPFMFDQLIQISNATEVEIVDLSLMAIVEEQSQDTQQAQLQSANVDPSAVIDMPEATTVSLSGNPNKVKIGITIQGDFDNIYDFLSKVESARRILTVDSISYTKDSNDKSSEASEEGGNETEKKAVTHKFSLVLTGYYMPEAAVSGLSVDQLVGQPRLVDTVTLLEAMDYYEPEAFELETVIKEEEKGEGIVESIGENEDNDDSDEQAGEPQP